MTKADNDDARQYQWQDESQRKALQRAESATDLVTPDMGEGELEFRPCDRCATLDVLVPDELCQGCDHNRAVIEAWKARAEASANLADLAKSEGMQRYAKAFREAAEIVRCSDRPLKYRFSNNAWAKACEYLAAHFSKLADEAEKG